MTYKKNESESERKREGHKNKSQTKINTPREKQTRTSKIEPKIWDSIIACVSQRRGNLISACCGALRQLRYRLEMLFLDRSTRIPRL